MQRDLESNLLVVDLGNIVADSTGDDDGAISFDTKGARSVTFFLDTATTLTTQVSHFQILESSDDGDADAFALIGEAKYLPTQLLAEVADGSFGILLVNPTAPYKQQFGCFSTERYLKPRITTTTSQGSVTFACFAIMRMAEMPTLATRDPNVTGGDALP